MTSHSPTVLRSLLRIVPFQEGDELARSCPHCASTIGQPVALLFSSCPVRTKKTLAGGSINLTAVVASLRPLSPVPSIVRKLPTLKPVGPAAMGGAGAAERAGTAPSAPPVASPPNRPAVVAPLAPDRYKVQITVSRDTYHKLRQVQDLLRHTIPNGDPAAIFDRALTLLLADLERKKLAATARPRPRHASSSASRHIPAEVRRRVWARDSGRCAFVGANGRCTEQGFLEFHHVVPYAAGGLTTIENLELRCRSHNAYEAEQYFGSLLVRETQSSWSGPPSDGTLGPDLVGWLAQPSCRSAAAVSPVWA
jgi:hypothetical protein